MTPFNERGEIIHGETQNNPQSNNPNSSNSAFQSNCGCLFLAGIILVIGYFGITSIINSQKPTSTSQPSANSSQPYFNESPNSSSSVKETDTPSPDVPSQSSSIKPDPTTEIKLSPTNTQIETIPSGEQTNLKDHAKLIFIPKSEFLMGLSEPNIDFLCQVDHTCDRETLSHSNPEHKVMVNDFWIYEFEVTNAQYRACVQVGSCTLPHKNSSHTHEDYFINRSYDNYPVINVDWFQADQYCNWASARLLTEAEWEKAARGTNGNIWPWGNNPPVDNLANLASTNLSTIDDTTEVGSFPSGASVYGVMDMAGNVYEWVSDWYATYYYRDSPYENPHGPDKSSRVDGKKDPLRVVKGGSCGYGTWQASSGLHDSWEPNKFGTGVGFRCALSKLQ